MIGRSLTSQNVFTNFFFSPVVEYFISRDLHHTNQFIVGLALCSLGFVCNDEIITLSSGDVLVMDAMAVLHGVQSILPDDCDIELPLQGSRLGVLLWQARQVDPVEGSTRGKDETIDGMHMLYYDDDDSSDDDVDAV